jgi:hypothetical protein
MKSLPGLFFHSRGAGLLLVATAITALLCGYLPLDLAVNPFNVNTGVLLLQLPGLAAGIFWALNVGTPMAQLEQSLPQGRLRILRGTWFFIGFISLGGLGAAAYAIRWPEYWALALVHIRNSMIGIGVGTMSGILLPKQAAWIPMALITGACWLAGTVDNLGTASLWAIPCYPIDSAFAGIAALCLFLAAGGGYSFHVPRA